MLETNNMTKTQNNYAQKLQDPRWQRKRLEVLQKANWKCDVCGDDREELNVHHAYYNHLREPWEYDDLQCLCKTCHTIKHLPKEKMMFHAKQIVTEHVVITHRKEFCHNLRNTLKAFVECDDFQAVIVMQKFLLKIFAEYDSLTESIDERFTLIDKFLYDRVTVKFSKSPSLEQLELADRNAQHLDRIMERHR